LQHSKKIVALALCLVLALSLCTVAFATTTTKESKGGTTSTVSGFYFRFLEDNTSKYAIEEYTDLGWEKVTTDGDTVTTWEPAYYTVSEDVKNYGGYTIYVCDEWRNKETGESTFIRWAIDNGYKIGLTVERMNKGIYHQYQNGPYAPWNCKIATRREQANNKRNNIYLTVFGITHTLPDWARLIGCDIKTARALHRSDPNKLHRFIAEKIAL